MAENHADRPNPTRSPIVTRKSGRKTKFAGKKDENSVESEKRMPFEEFQSGNHPSFADMIVTDIEEIKDPQGSTRSSILKFILTQFVVKNSVEFVLKRMTEEFKIALKSGRLLNPGLPGKKPNLRRFATPNCRLKLVSKEEKISAAEAKKLLRRPPTGDEGNYGKKPLGTKARRPSPPKPKVLRSKVVLEPNESDSDEQSE